MDAFHCKVQVADAETAAALVLAACHSLAGAPKHFTSRRQSAQKDCHQSHRLDMSHIMLRLLVVTISRRWRFLGLKHDLTRHSQTIWHKL